MTQTISREQRGRAVNPHEPAGETSRKLLIIRLARAFTVLTATAGVALTAIDLASDGSVHLVGPAVACMLFAGMGLLVLAFDAILADRQEFYRRGHLEGWYRGYRMQNPECDDPLLK